MSSINMSEIVWIIRFAEPAPKDKACGAIWEAEPGPGWPPSGQLRNEREPDKFKQETTGQVTIKYDILALLFLFILKSWYNR